jgi:hypothetical protein
MRHVSPSEFEPQPPQNPLRVTAIVIYLTLALLAVTIPQGLTNWLSDMNGNAAQETALRGAEVLRNLSERAGVAGAYRRGRDIFIAVSGVDAD